MKKFFFTVVLCFLCLFTVALYAQSGKIDTTFNPYDDGKGGDGANGSINATAIQTDGKIIIGGSFTKYNENGRLFVARINPDGSIDTTFT